MTNKTSHILIVDDNPENIRVLGAALERNKYKITIALSGETAFKMAEQHLPDLILLDVMMPIINGFQVCESLKANPITKNIEVIFVTAAIAHEDELKGLALGAVDYIHKPFSIPVVQAKVALHLERARYKKELELKNAALEEVSRLRDDIDLMTRHDLKSPLNAILGFPQLMLSDDNLTREQYHYLELILSAGTEMLNMINNSLDLFKMETDRYHYTPEPVDMVSVIEHLTKDLRMLTDGYRVKIKVWVEGLEDTGNRAFMVLAEKSLSYSLFANLIRNAIEACAVNDTITIAMQHENNEAVISVTNPGTVPEAMRATFFEKYSTSGKAQGTGLGTYSAKLMATTQKGTIAMASNNQETCITVKLPIA